MAVSIIAEPQILTPAYNSMYFYLDSTNKAQLGFRYVVNVLASSGSTPIGTYRSKPIPTTLYGEIDIAKVIQTKLYPNFLTGNSYVNDGHLYGYRLKIDEEYFINLSFSDYGFAGAGWPNFSDPSVNPSGFSRTFLKTATLPAFVAGDVINVQQTAGSGFRPELEGIHTVLDVYLSSGFYYIVLDLLWIGSGATWGGVVSYADGRKSIVEGSTTTVRRAYIGAFPFMTFKSYDHTNYLLQDEDRLLLTSLPVLNEIRISRNTPTWLSAYIQTGSAYNVQFQIEATKYRYPLTAVNGKVSTFNVLPTDVTEVWNGTTWVAFSGDVDLSSVLNYNVQLHIGDDPVSNAYQINLYSECDFYDKYDITFLDRMGSWITIPFYKGSYIQQDVQREVSRKKYGGFDTDSWAYESTDKGNQIYHIEENLLYTVNSDQLNEAESQYIRELISTPQAYVSVNGGEHQAIIIENASQQLYKKRTARDRKISLQFRMAVQDEING